MPKRKKPNLTKNQPKRVRNNASNLPNETQNTTSATIDTTIEFVISGNDLNQVDNLSHEINHNTSSKIHGTIANVINNVTTIDETIEKVISEDFFEQHHNFSDETNDNTINETIDYVINNVLTHVNNENEENGCTQADTTQYNLNLANKPAIFYPDCTIVREEFYPQVYFGALDTLCSYCGSLNFRKEKPTDGKFSKCCHKGTIKLPDLPDIEYNIFNLLTENTVEALHFRNNIRVYNNAVAFASLGASLQIPPGRGAYCFRVQGQIHHYVSPVCPPENQNPCFSQLYFIESSQANQIRIQNADICILENVLNKLDSIIRRNNPYANAYKLLHEVIEQEKEQAQLENRSMLEFSMSLVDDPALDSRRYNPAVSNEVAAIFQNHDGEPPNPLNRNMRIYMRHENKVQKLCFLSKHCDPMIYPIFFPFGTPGWHPGLKKETTGNITMLQYFSYRLAIRQNPNILLMGGKLTHQFIVDAYVKIEGNRLNYIRANQKKIRAESYAGLQDYVSARAANEGLKAGKSIVLPTSFTGSPRAMNQQYQDAMAIVRKFGRPDLFITMTCNPNWPEILENLYDGQTPVDRPDLIARVFRLKLQELLDDVTFKSIFGTIVAKVYVIEFQKRGLPHCHMLIILSDASKIRDKDDIDRIVSAEIPDPLKNPRLHEYVKKHMIHGPCGSINPNCVCMNNKECKKGFPKPYAEETRANVDGYPFYRRRKDGNSVNIKDMTVDNQWVVPYNPFLLLKFNCHINVEICASIKSVKYLFKYVYKGHDCASVRISSNTIQCDEIQNFLDTRYVSAPESMWRTLEFKMHEQSHTIIRLAIHLENQQTVYFEQGQEETAVLNAFDSTLTAYFKLNELDEFARGFFYHEIPEHYVYDKKLRQWKPRQRKENVVGRMYAVNPSERERFFLRLLLLHIKGATSFSNLQIVNGVNFGSFEEAAKQNHLLLDDTEWNHALFEASTFQMPAQLRSMFAYICIFCCPSSPITLWEKFKSYFSEDFTRTFPTTLAESYALKDIHEILSLHGKTLEDFNLPSPSLPHSFQNTFTFDLAEEQAKSIELISQLNQEQKIVFDQIMGSVNGESNDTCFFLDGPGGSGKTFLYNTLMSTIRGMGKTVLPVASTGISATLLKGGRTYHSQFKLPVPLLDNSTSRITNQSIHAQELRKASLIIWDECTMAPLHALEAVDRLLKDITCHDDIPFGGKTLLIGGDFRQTLPIVKRGHRAAIVQTCLKRSHLWQYFTHFSLKKNMRAQFDNDFSEWLLKLGEGRLPTFDSIGPDVIELPLSLICEASIVDEIFDQEIDETNMAMYSKRCILCPTNDDTHQINETVLKKITSTAREFRSIDSIVSDNENEHVNFPQEFLNSLTPSGMPPHLLNLKIGSIVMLLRNLNIKKGLCNGSRMTIHGLHDNVIVLKPLNTNANDNLFFLPRIDLTTTDADFPFVMKRRQFPIRLSFAMTINKSQGQTFEKVGVFLRKPVFSHGQLYVALSRAPTMQSIKIQLENTDTQGQKTNHDNKYFTENIVFREVLQ